MKNTTNKSIYKRQVKKNKYLTFGLILFLLSINASGTIIMEIKDTSSIPLNENILYVGGSGPNNYTKIQDAIDYSNDGDIVYVYNDSSPYYENLKVHNSIFLFGEDTNSTIIIGNNQSSTIFFTTADSITVSGFTIKGSLDDIDFAGIKMYTSRNIITNNIFVGHRNGILVCENSNSNIIKDNIFLDNNKGIMLDNSYNNLIYSNDFYSNFDGIWQDSGFNNSIIKNYFENNGRGIRYNRSPSDNLISDNIMVSNYNGIKIEGHRNFIIGNNICFSRGEAIGVYYDYISKYNIVFIKNNTIYNNLKGLYLQACEFSIIDGNVIIDNNESGIELHGGFNNTIISNHIESNLYGLFISSSIFNTISCNNFIDNRMCFIYYRDRFNGDLIGINFCDSNYWDVLFGNVKIMFGCLRWDLIHLVLPGAHSTTSLGIFLPRIHIDWNPASEPYDIGV